MTQPGWRLLILTGIVCALSAGSPAARGQSPALDALHSLIRHNEAFGRSLLERVHRRQAERNTVVAPMPVSLILAALGQSASSTSVATEIASVVGPLPYYGAAARMLLTMFEKPSAASASERFRASMREGPSDAAWISNAIAYRGRGVLNEFFAERARRDFGMTLTSTGIRRPTAGDLERETGTPRAALPKMSGSNDLFITSGAHLRTTWLGNTFSMSKPRAGQFTTSAGERRPVTMATSELSRYRYAKTETFEAVVLQCKQADFLAVLPGESQTIADIERLLASAPDTVDSALEPQYGTVTLPAFRIAAEHDFTGVLQELGVTSIFHNLNGIVSIKDSRLAEIKQKVVMDVDKYGIRADAETVGGAVYGGVSSTPTVFRMSLDRPFVFLVRHRETGALLFLGALMDPAQK